MMKNVPEQRREPTLQETHEILKALHRKEFPKGAPHRSEVLRKRLPEYTSSIVLRKFKAIIAAETGKKVAPDQLSKEDQDAVEMFLYPQVLQAHKDVGRDAALSNDHHFIAHFDTQQIIVAQDLVRVAASENPESLKSLKRMGCVFFDVDGTKTIVDCTSHSHAGKYLEGLAEFLCKLSPELKQWLKERGLRSEAFTVAGDEFIVIIRSEEMDVEKELLDEFASKVQKAIANDPHLNSFISFDDPEFVMEYDDWSDEDRAQYKKDPDSMKKELQNSREKLPPVFGSSVSYGSAPFMPGLHEALSPDTEEAKTLEELGINAFRLMVARADARLKEDKKIFRDNLEDPKLKEFLLRNGENRRLERELQAAKEEISRLQSQLNLQIVSTVESSQEKKKAS